MTDPVPHDEGTRGIWFERCKPHRVNDLHQIFHVMIYGYLYLPPGLKMMVQSAEAADALELHFASVASLRTQLAEAIAERDAARALAATCSCGTSPMTYTGPEADCPVHGAVRAFNECSAHLSRALKVVEAAEAWRHDMGGIVLGHFNELLAAAVDTYRKERNGG